MGYDSVGNRTSMSCNMPSSNLGTGDTTYAQDDKNELTSEQSTRNGGISNSFAYDTAFNPTTFRNQTRTFNANNQDTIWMVFTLNIPKGSMGMTNPTSSAPTA